MTEKTKNSVTQIEPETPSKSQAEIVFIELIKNPVSLFSVLIVLTVLITAVAAPLIAPHDPNLQSLRLRLKPPIWQEGSEPGHILGTDALGRDMLSRIIYGSRISMIVGVASVIVQGGIGILIGLVAGYYGGWVDTVSMRIADIQQAIPFLILVVAVTAIVNPSLTNIIIVLGISGWVTYGRVVRGEVLSIRNREFVESARAIGASDLSILFQHILPNVINSVIVIGTLTVSTMILAEASLSYLGLGVPPPASTWGGAVADGRDYLVTAWWVSVLPGIAIFLTVLAINLLGDWLREVFDPTL